VPKDDGDEVKIGGTSAITGLTVTVNTTVGCSTKVVGTFSDCDLQVTGGKISFGRRVQIGSGPGASYGNDTGYMTQSGGTVEINGSCLFAIGYKASGAGAEGTYTISGGTFQGTTSTAVLRVGGTSGAGMTGTFNVVGTSGTINMAGDMYVASGTGSMAGTGTGIIKFDLDDGAASRIKVRDSYIDAANEVIAVANLVVNADVAPAGPALVLIENTSTNAVTGKFDTINSWGGRFVNLGGSTYWLSYTWNAGTSLNNGNDIALILVPEPATIVLLAIGGLIAAKRRK